ncbi:MAG: hypothetical protein QNJ72_03740 [Pleurocapsa sp. MO_226.B13]|nr:hypothetical protein [Pleurocapsa sp. MO_226.B13]
MNPYLRLAYNTAREFERRDSRFCLSQKKPLAQGKNNCIILGYYNDKPVVLKFYNDSLKPNSFRRKLTETFFLRHAASTGVVPELVFESDRFIIIEEIAGWSLEKKLSQPNPDLEDWLSKVAIGIGSAHARLGKLSLSEKDCSHFNGLLCGGKALVQTVEEVLEGSSTICREVEVFYGLQNTVEYIKEHISIILNEPRIVYRYDNNLGNTIVTDKGFEKFIDFEDCYEGTRTIYLGAIFDCLHQMPWNVPPWDLTIYQCLPWKYVKYGYELETNEPIDESYLQQLIAMAMFNAWLRVIRTWRSGLNLSFWGPRFRKRLDTYWSMTGQGNVNSLKPDGL